MDQLLEAIRTATTSGATAEARIAGAHACRTILTALEAIPGQPLAPIAAPSNAMEAAVGVLRGIPPDQLLDLAIARLKAALPADTKVEQVRPFALPLVPIPAPGRRS